MGSVPPKASKIDGSDCRGADGGGGGGWSSPEVRRDPGGDIKSFGGGSPADEGALADGPWFWEYGGGGQLKVNDGLTMAAVEWFRW